MVQFRFGRTGVVADRIGSWHHFQKIGSVVYASSVETVALGQYLDYHQVNLLNSSTQALLITNSRWTVRQTKIHLIRSSYSFLPHPRR